jgi:hypothetical protein
MIEARPLSEEECMAANLPPKGIFPFSVQMTKEKNSDKVGKFFSIKLNLETAPGKARVMYDALFFTESMMWKTRHFYRSANLMDIYETGRYQAQDLDWAKGFCEVEHKADKTTGEIKAFVKDYISPEATPEEPFIDDDLPNL